MMTWELLVPGMTPEHLGLLPLMLDENDPRPAKDQFNENYSHGGGWRPMKGFKLQPDNSLTYPEDEPLKPLAQLQFRNELIVFYDHAWVAIIHKDRYFEACRMD
jgi:hypothetical protein